MNIKRSEILRATQRMTSFTRIEPNSRNHVICKTTTSKSGQWIDKYEIITFLPPEKQKPDFLELLFNNWKAAKKT